MSFCQHDFYLTATATLTQNPVLVNESAEKFWVPIALDTAQLRRDVRQAEALERCVPPGAADLWTEWCSLRTVRSRARVVAIVDALVGAAVARPSRDVSRFISELLACLWAHGHLAFPARPPAGLVLPMPEEKPWFGPVVSWWKRVEQGSAHFSKGPTLLRFILSIVQCCVGLRSVDDVTPATASVHVLNARVPRPVIRCLTFLHRQHYNAHAVQAAHQHWPVRRRSRQQSDPTFAWARKRDARLTRWCECLARWVDRSASKSHRIGFGNRLLGHLVQQAHIPESPRAFLREESDAAERFRAALADGRAAVTASRLAQEFFEAVRNEVPVKRRYQYCNPFVRVRGTPAACETHRTPMPTRFIRELIDILRSDWPRQFEQDWMVVPAADGTAERIWCPVRASALLLKLMLPLRTHQIRFVESDEGDTLQWRDGQWLPNTLPTAPPPGAAVRLSFLREWEDPDTRQRHLGFFVNTNKKTVRDAFGRDGGYCIPWTHRDAIAVVEELLQWQQTHNALEKPGRWEALSDLPSVKEGHPRKGKVCFLMRDPNATYPNEPVSSARIGQLWVALLREYEKRLAARRECMSDGTPLRLFRLSAKGNLVPRFDLHGLRVSLLTALLVEGDVPLPFLSKCIAGHASVAMTLYYVKLSPRHMNDRMTEAAQRIAASERDNFRDYLAGVQRDIRTIYVGNEPHLAGALGRSEDTSPVVGNLGLCPVNRQRCRSGGTGAGGEPAPTPGGYGNCLQCRHFITGPAFVDGLVNRFNELSTHLRIAAEAYQQACEIFDAVEVERLQCTAGGRLFGRWSEHDAASARRETAQREVDRLSSDWQACFGLIHRSKAAIRPQDDLVPLVLGGSEADLQEALNGAADLVRAACMKGIVHARLPVETMPRAQVLEAVLTEGRDRMVLSPPESRHVGRERTKFLLAVQPEDAGLPATDALGLAEAWQPVLHNVPPVEGSRMLGKSEGA